MIATAIGVLLAIGVVCVLARVLGFKRPGY